MEMKTSIGEVVDKLTILSIKIKKITNNEKLSNVYKEYQYVKELVSSIGIDQFDIDRLCSINEKLWVIEDDIRDKEMRSEFDDVFIELARSVYITNDERARVKKEINIRYGSEFVEEKSYSDYTSQIEDKYRELCLIPSDINEHLPIIRYYADQCDHITEFGVRYPVSTWSLLSSNPKEMISYDIQMDEGIYEVIRLANRENINFKFNLSDVLTIDIDSTDLLFIDTLHTYSQLSRELTLHSSKVRKYIILHDTLTYGLIDEELYQHASDLVKMDINTKQGLRYAITDFINSNQDWVIDREYLNNNGLTILKRLL